MEPTKRKDGRYVLTLTVKGQKKFFYGSTKAEVKRKVSDFKKKQITGKDFKNVSDDWWEEHEPNLSMQSRRGYLKAKKMADEEFGKKAVKKIEPTDINEYFKVLNRLYPNAKTFNKYKQVLNQIFTYALQEGDIEYNPCAAARTPKSLKSDKRRSASSEDEEKIKTSSSEWLFPFFALHTGMRKGEILALQWRDIDFDEDLISVTKSVEHNGDRPSVKDPKTEAGIRYVPLLNPLKERLLKIQPRRELDYIFSDDGTKPLTNRRYITLYNQYRAENEIQCTSHQLRHSFATIAFENGLDPKSVQEILGHKQLSTTMEIYTDFRKKAVKNAANKLNEAFK